MLQKLSLTIKGGCSLGVFVTHPVLDWTTAQLANGRKVAVATVLSAGGSVPGKPGARIALSDLGEIFGTVGGAGLELSVCEKLSTLLQEKGEEHGGYVETFQLHKDAKGQAGTPLDSLCGGRVTLSFEVIQPMPHILLCGGGHCGKAITEACELLDWKYSIFDVRSEFSDKKTYPNAEELHNSSAEDFLANEDSSSLARFSDVLLLGHQWSVDEVLLNGMLTKQQNDPNAWRSRIGVIGSKSKWNSFSESALGDGIEQQYLDGVDCPIGLNVGAETPAEIAIAVVGQLLSRIKSQDPEEPSWREVNS